MLLRNYYNMLAYSTCGMNYGSTFGDGSLKLKKVNGDSFDANSSNTSIALCGKVAATSTNPPNSETNMEPNDLNTFTIGFGTGDIPVTFDDYKLSSWVNFTYSSPASYSVSYDSATKRYSKMFSINIQNTTNAEIVVKEVGIYTRIAPYPFLISREVLETPFTVGAGETVTYKHTLEFTFPTIT